MRLFYFLKNINSQLSTIKEEIIAKIRKSALQNAVRYEKPPKVDAVLKKILSEHPELRKVFLSSSRSKVVCSYNFS